MKSDNFLTAARVSALLLLWAFIGPALPSMAQPSDFTFLGVLKVPAGETPQDSFSLFRKNITTQRYEPISQDYEMQVIIGDKINPTSCR